MRSITLSTLLLSALLPIYEANAVNVTITINNLSESQGAALTPFFVAFHDGSFDPFDLGTSASAEIELLAELGDGSGLAANFNAVHPDGVAAVVTASVNGFGPGVFLSGASGSISVDLDPVKNRYLSYFAMVVPSNDRFVGNDSPTELVLFDDAGNFVGGTFQDNGYEIWDAGTEFDSAASAAFLTGSIATDSPAQNGVIQANTDFSFYQGFATPAGYDFTNLPGANEPLLRITALAAVPVPATLWLFGSALPLFGFLRRRSHMI